MFVFAHLCLMHPDIFQKLYYIHVLDFKWHDRHIQKFMKFRSLWNNCVFVSINVHWITFKGIWKEQFLKHIWLIDKIGFVEKQAVACPKEKRAYFSSLLLFGTCSSQCSGVMGSCFNTLGSLNYNQERY